MSAGRPTKFKTAYCNEVITHMAEGASLTSFAAEIGVCRATITVWMDDHPEFLAAVNVAKAKCAAWWEAVNRKIAKDGGGTGSAQACALGLKNMARDDWVERSEVNVNVKDNLAETIAERRRQVTDGNQG